MYRIETLQNTAPRQAAKAADAIGGYSFGSAKAQPVIYDAVSRWVMRSSSAQTSAMRPEIVMRPAHAGFMAASCSLTTRSRATGGCLDSKAADLKDETRPVACLQRKLLVLAKGNVIRWWARGALAGGTSGWLDAGRKSHAAKALTGAKSGAREESWDEK